MKKILLLLAALAALGAGAWYFTRTEKVEESPYRFAEIERGDLESTVSSSGTLSPVTTVQVGTQVSGRVSQIFVDFNDRVRRGQLIATIDTTLLASAIRDAEAGLERAQAQLRQAERELQRITPLFQKKISTEVEYNKARYDVEIARATVVSSRVSLDRARQNLQYATIRAPIDGTVIERNVDVGQTVAASLSAPQLFLIANDLTRMQILAAVDESDIGRIRQGQRVRFNVQAHADRSFEGVVRQIRLQSKTEQNVVNYTVVVDVANDDGLLLPGMTATVDFLIERTADVLKVPNAALRFRPTEEMLAQVRDRATGPDSSRAARARAGAQAAPTGAQATPAAAPARAQGSPRRAAGANPAATGRGNRPDGARLWYLDAQGRLAVARVTTGISDGQMTEVSGPDLKEGMQIITGVRQTTAEPAANNPFQSRQQSGPGPGGPRF